MKFEYDGPVTEDFSWVFIFLSLNFLIAYCQDDLVNLDLESVKISSNKSRSDSRSRSSSAISI